LKKHYHIKILEQQLSVLSDSGDEHVARVIAYVNEKLGEIKGKSENVNTNTLHVVILAALNIADEYLQLKGKREEIGSQLENRCEKLIHLINEVS